MVIIDELNIIDFLIPDPLKFLILFVLGLIISFIFSAAVGILLEYLIFRQLRNRNATPGTMMIASIGAAFMIRFLLIEAFTRNSIAFYMQGQPGLVINKFIVIFMAIFFIIALDLLVTRTKIGKSMRAVANNPQLAQASGISLSFVIIIVWIIGAGFAGVAGMLKVFANTPLTPELGFKLLLPTFAVVILGGIGSYRGAIVAGFIIGFAENIGTLFFGDLKVINERLFPGLLDIGIPIPVFNGLDLSIVNFNVQFTFQPAYQLAWGFLILVVVLLIKPTGLFGEELAKDR
jgi:branched-subunit amino acid ABC-type transport system permease component